MKRIFVLGCLMLFALNVYADSNSKCGDILVRMSAKIEAMDCYRVEFSVSAKDMGTSEGYYIVDGEKYRIKIEQQEQFSDGEFRYEINSFDKEVLLDEHDPNSRNILVNPPMAFRFDEELYDSKLISEQEGVAEIELTPTEGVLDGISRVILKVDTKTELPIEMSYDFDGVNLVIQIISFKEVDGLTSLFFEFVPIDYLDYEIIDFR